MQKIVLDTNVLIMSISAKNEYHYIWKSFLKGDFTLCISNEILEEYLEVISRNINPNVAQYVVYVLLERKNVQLVDTFYHFHLIQTDPDDNKFVDCAIVSNARYIVTQDKHFNVLKTIDFPKVEIIDIDNFLRELLA